jgi:signal transduction histidine kinase
MPDAMDFLLSTLQTLPDDTRAEVERELVAIARLAVLGELAPDVVHDVGNPLLGVLGLVELLIDDAPPGSDVRSRLELVQTTGLELRQSLRELIDLRRVAESGRRPASLDDTVRAAVSLVRHGGGKRHELRESYPETPALVDCDPGAVLQAVVHVLVAARAAAAPAGAIGVTVEPGTLRVSPGGPESFGTVAARRIAVDNGGSLERDGDALVQRLPVA